MKRLTKTVLFLFPLAAAIASAQSAKESPLPDITSLIRQAILQQRLAEKKEPDYLFREDINDIRLRRECTWAPKCPAPIGVKGVRGVPFEVLRYSERYFEIFWLEGVRVVRILPPCEECGKGAGPVEAYIKNIPVSDSEVAIENQRVDKEVAEAKALLAKGKNVGSPDDPPQIILSRMLELCTFSNPRRQTIEGRHTILVDFAWDPSTSPASANEDLIKSLTGTIGLDEEDRAVEHVEGSFLADVKLDRNNIKIRKGTRITITNRQVEDGIWLLERMDAQGEGHYYSFAINGEGHIFTGNYRKFRSTSKVLSVSTDTSARPSKPSN